MSENTHGTADESQERQAWFGDALRPYVHSGGLPTVPSSSLTLGTFATTAYVRGASGDLVYVSQAAKGVGPLNSGNGAYWVALHRNTSSSVSGWTRQAGTHYLWKQAASLPADPSGGLVLANVTVSGGAITAVADCRTPASYARSGVFDVTDPLYGAVGDASTDCTTAIQAAVDRLAQTGGVVWVPPGTYKLTAEIRVYYDNVVVRGAGWDSVLKMFSGGSLNAVLGCLTFGLDTSTAEVPISGIVVEDLHLDANDLCVPLYVRETSLSYFRRLMCENSKKSLAFFRECHSVYLQDSYLTDSNATDQYGDGVYMEGCTDMRILHNHIYDFKRIGIVSEQESGGSIVSTNPLILGNHIQYGHDATVSEHNFGIWMEHTNGGRIIANHIYDLYNTPLNQPGGIKISDGQTAECVFEVTDNVIRQVYTGSTTPNAFGINIASEVNYTTVLVKGNRIESGYVYGVYIAEANNVLIEGNYFGTNTFYAATGCILLDGDQGSGINHVYVGPNHKGTMTYNVVTAADLVCYSTGTAGEKVPSVTLQGLKDWKIIINEKPLVLYIHDCDLTQDGNTVANFGVGAYTRLEMTDSRLTDSYAAAGTLPGVVSKNGAVLLVSNCVFSGVYLDAATTGASQMTSTYTGCSFSGGSYFHATKNGTIYFKSCYIGAYPSGGFFTGADSAGTLNIFVWDCIVVQGANNTTFVKGSVDADIFCAYKTLKDSAITNLTSFTPAITGFVEQNSP